MFGTIWFAIKWFFLSPLLPWVSTASVIAVVCALLFLMVPGLTAEARRWCLMIGVGAVAFIFASSYFFELGQDHQAQKTAAKDKAAIQRNERKQHDVDACNNGVDWDVTTGTCAAAP